MLILEATCMSDSTVMIGNFLFSLNIMLMMLMHMIVMFNKKTSRYENEYKNNKRVGNAIKRKEVITLMSV